MSPSGFGPFSTLSSVVFALPQWVFSWTCLFSCPFRGCFQDELGGVPWLVSEGHHLTWTVDVEVSLTSMDSTPL